MEVYNIRKAKFAATLQASGIANRWNKAEEFVIYAGSSISLATLELIAHRSGIDVKSDYKLLFIHLDIQEEDIRRIELCDLPDNWQSIASYPILQRIGSAWYREEKELVLRVPSALVHWEYNYLINTRHPLFSAKIQLKRTEEYPWDRRLL